MGRPKKNTYLTSDDIYRTWSEWKRTGVVSEEMGNQMLLLSRKVMGGHQFYNYPMSMKEEMIQEGCVKIMKNLHNMKETMKDCFFNYWTRCVYTACYVYLGKYYKMLNSEREIMLQSLLELRDENINGQGNTEAIRHLEDLIERFGKHDGEED